VTEDPVRQRFNPTGFAMVVTLFVFSAASFVAPGYADVGDPWRWIMYAIGVLSYLLGCVGITVVVGNAYGGVEGFRLSVYVLGLFTLASALHLGTVYVPHARLAPHRIAPVRVHPRAALESAHDARGVQDHRSTEDERAPHGGRPRPARLTGRAPAHRDQSDRGSAGLGERTPFTRLPRGRILGT
jgi:hypothetical protein